MLSVCLIFLYILLSAYIIGFLVLTVMGRVFGGPERRSGQETKEPGILCNAAIGADAEDIALCHAERPDGCVMAGLVAVTVYAQFFSLFYKVGLLANALLLGVCVAAAVMFRRELLHRLKEACSAVHAGRNTGYLILFLLFAYGTSRGVIHYDTGLYHAQSIRWIEEYGVVKGLGNLHCRLAYNSASFSLSAFYSFSFLGGQSYHCMAGFLALLLAKVCGEITEAWKRKRLFLSDIARIMGIYYLMIIFDEMISPASDYFMVLTVFYIVIRYLDLVEKGEKSWIPFGLLALLCVYTMSLKLSAALIVLLAAKPAAMLIKEKNLKGIAGFLGLGILILLPYLIRNVLISGWLVYPFTSMDFFPVDWKIPKGTADYDAKEIQVWGRGIYDVARYGEPPWKWMKDWFAMQAALDKLFILAGIAAVPLSCLAWLIGAVKGKEKLRDLMLAAVTVNFSFLFWLFSAPLIRYGCVYVWLTAPLTFGAGALQLSGKEGWGKLLWRTAYFLTVVAGCYKLFAFGKEIRAGYSREYFICQKDYENYAVTDYEIDGITFYYPVEGDRTGYEAFPSSPSRVAVRLRGTGIEDGFMYTE